MIEQLRNSEAKVGELKFSTHSFPFWLMAVVITSFLAQLAWPMIDNAHPSLIDDSDIIFALQGDS